MTLAINEPQTRQLATANANAGNPVTAMLQTIIENGITADTASTMEKLTDLYLKVEGENARKSFAAAKCAMQAELPRVFAARVIPDNNGNVRSVFAAYEDIMKVVQPMLVKHGFSVSFTSRYDSTGKVERLCVICNLNHIDGHTESNEFAVRVGGPPKSSDAQADGSTHSYAKRYALCDALNITIDKDNDARVEGDYIRAEEAAALEAMADEVGADKAAFLRFAAADSFGQIRSERLASLWDALEAKGRSKPTNPVDPAAATWQSFVEAAEEIAKARRVDADLFVGAMGKLKLTQMSRPSNTAARSDWLGKFASGAKLATDGTLS